MIALLLLAMRLMRRRPKYVFNVVGYGPVFIPPARGGEVLGVRAP